MRALVVDDSRAMRMMLSRMLTEIGFEVETAENGRVALECLQQNSDLAIALDDWNMPELNGYDFVTQVRANQSYDGIRLMMVTTETEMSQVARALDAGADEYVMKPFTKEIIRDKLAILGVTPS